ncbi:Protein Y69A2AR.31 [Aphelenchoides avenae]|nr:Protein Y69A2AR.31 [Aphelenchus avenae]
MDLPGRCILLFLIFFTAQVNVRHHPSSNYSRDLAVVRTFFGKPEDCWCFEGLGKSCGTVDVSYAITTVKFTTYSERTDPSVDDESRRQLQWERQNMQRQQDLEAQRRQDLETRRQVELEAQRQRVMQAQKQRDAAALRQRELEAHRQRELLVQQQRELERQRQLAAEAQRQRTLEEQRQREMEAQRRREQQAQAAFIRARSSEQYSSHSATTVITPDSAEYVDPTSAYRTSSGPNYLSSHQSSRETGQHSHPSRGTTNNSRGNPNLVTSSYHLSNTTVGDRYLYDYATGSATTTSTVPPTTPETPETSAPEPPIATASSIRAYTQISQPPTSPMPSTTSTTTEPLQTDATTTQASTTSRPYRKPSPVISSKKPRPTQADIRQKPAVLKEYLENYVISNTSWQATGKGSSTCLAAYETCELNETCKWHLSEVRMKCRLDEECVREQCAAALRRFARYVPKRTVESLMFCTCSFGDGACKHQQQWMYPRCLYSYSREKPRWSCTQIVKLCQSDSHCLRHLPNFNRSCSVSTVASDEGSSSECTATDLVACRNSLLTVRATYLEMPCYCHVNDSKCLQQQNVLLPNNPCIEDVMDHYGNPHVDRRRPHFTASASDAVLEKSSTTSMATTVAIEPENAEQENSASSANGAETDATNSTDAIVSTTTTPTVAASAGNSSSVNQSTTLALRRTQFSKGVLGGKYVTQTPPPKEGGCVTRNIDGEWIRHYKGSLLRQYHDWSGRCSSWCICTQNETLTCKELPCLPEGNCETTQTTIKFGEKLYIDGRGACMCQSSNFICDTSDESAFDLLPPGLYITIGYSKAELKLIKENVPKLQLEKSGLVSPDVSVANDITSRLQFALERIVPKDTLCRIVLLENFKESSVMLLQKCSPFIQRLEQIFLLEQGDRYQLVLSTELGSQRAIPSKLSIPVDGMRKNAGFCYAQLTIFVIFILYQHCAVAQLEESDADAPPFEVFEFDMEKAQEPDVDFPDSPSRGHGANSLSTQVVLGSSDIPNPTRSNAFIGSGPPCEAANELPTFIRHSMPTPKTRSPNFVRRMNSLSDCAESCRRRVEPVSDTGKSTDRSCEFFDSNATLRMGPSEDLGNRTSYFERACLPIPSACSQSAFAFDIASDRFLNIAPVETVAVGNDRKRCLDLCLVSRTCKAVNFNISSGVCEVLEHSYRSVDMRLTESEGMDYYENMCSKEKNRCPNGRRIEFAVTKNAEVYGLSVAMDVSVDLCMEHCLLSDACMAFTFDRPERNCKLLEQSQRDLQSRADPHPSADYYELACERKAVFRSTELTSSGTGTSGLPFTSTQSQTTLPPSRDASLSALSIAAERAKVGTSLAPVVGKSACDTEHGMLVEKGRTLRLEFRNIHRVNVRTLRQCEELCAKTAIKCATFAYSPRSRDCLLSSSSIDRNSRFAVITQASQSFDLYAFLGSACILGTKGIVSNNRELVDATKSTYPARLISRVPLLATATRPQLRKVTRPTATPAVREFTAMMFLKEESTTTQVPTVVEDPFDITTQLTEEPVSPADTIAPVTTTTPRIPETEVTLNSQPSTTPAATSVRTLLKPFRTVSPRKKFFDEPTETNPTATATSLTTNSSFDHESTTSLDTTPTSTTLAREETTTEETQPATAWTESQIPHRITTVGRITSGSVKVKAACLDSGVNVTFRVTGVKYTGAVYAAERFSQCRVFVENQDEFSMFIPRPSVNNWCNALEADNELTAVIVMTNDMVFPYDVTTKDDFFYQITCDYSDSDDQQSVVHSGIVVGGPEPKSVVSSARHSEDRRTHVSLKILKDNRPVNNVYIGEFLDYE